jgi:hypothetical protein
MLERVVCCLEGVQYRGEEMEEDGTGGQFDKAFWD